MGYLLSAILQIVFIRYIHCIEKVFLGAEIPFSAPPPPPLNAVKRSEGSVSNCIHSSASMSIYFSLCLWNKAVITRLL